MQANTRHVVRSRQKARGIAVMPLWLIMSLIKIPEVPQDAAAAVTAR
jgi:hypothetical protein